MNYFQKASETNKQKDEKKKNLIENQNNLIKNLKYNVNFENGTQYNITAKLSELFYENESEFVKMQYVIAEFIDEEGVALTIISDNAIYNNTTYNTKFSKNIKLTYLSNIIDAENLDLNFIENIVTIRNNVVYEGVQGQFKADNVVINLITKELKIFMNDQKNKVEIKSK